MAKWTDRSFSCLRHAIQHSTHSSQLSKVVQRCEPVGRDLTTIWSTRAGGREITAKLWP
jgi:hypothetical protein